MADYTAEWYQAFEASSRESARHIVPIVLDLTGAKSVVDLGCGQGVWLSEFVAMGIRDVLGVDGEYVERENLHIPPACFQPHDLATPLRVDRHFDLAMSLEVAEHLPEASAESLVDSLTQFAPIVLFSAAVPGQGGRNHINEQWLEYWVEKFERRGHQLVDAVRPLVWDKSVNFWYAQNCLLFCDESSLSNNARLRDARERTSKTQISVIHPRLYKRTIDQLNGTLDFRVRRGFRAVKSFVTELLTRGVSQKKAG